MTCMGIRPPTSGSQPTLKDGLASARARKGNLVILKRVMLIMFYYRSCTGSSMIPDSLGTPAAPGFNLFPHAA